MKSNNYRMIGGLALPALLALSACGDGPTGPDGPTSVALSLSVPQPAAAASGFAAFALVQSDGANTLVLDRVAIVLRELELERQGDECDAMGSADQCEKFEVGPRLLELPLDGGLFAVGNVAVPPGSYDEVEFDIHKPSEGSADDAQFIQSNPDFAEVSIRVEGTYNGEAFVFLQDLMEKQERELTPVLAVEAGMAPSNLTLEMDVLTWFTDAQGQLVDPETANKGGDNENLVEANIKASIDAYKDDDRDGRRD